MQTACLLVLLQITGKDVDRDFFALILLAIIESVFATRYTYTPWLCTWSVSIQRRKILTLYKRSSGAKRCGGCTFISMSIENCEHFV